MLIHCIVVEALGADPYLNGIAFGLDLKHSLTLELCLVASTSLLNEQETNRVASGSSSVAPYSSVADDKTLHETYLW